MSEEIKKRIIRVLINSGVIILIVTALDLAIPGFLALIILTPTEGLSLSKVLIFLPVIVMMFLGLRIILDLIRLVDLTSEVMIKHIPGLRVGNKVSITRALKEIILVLIIILSATAISSFLLLVPEIGHWLVLVFSVVSIAVSIILIYDAGRTLYTVFESSIQLFINILSGEHRYSKSGEKGKEPEKP
ncbi:MAG: hypothetical protein QG670_1856 [Thermoproteota archaeon]|nr:hypothetical protein [Thermoproteota archaeon]